MIDKEKVRELADFLRVVDGDEFEEAITEWLEQNQTSPVVVGLSDEQIKDLACVVSSVDYDDFHTTRYDFLIQNWLKTQTFAQPEIKEVPVGLSDEQVDELMRHFMRNKVDFNAKGTLMEFLKTQTFAQPEVKEVVVGLSDEQIYKLYDYLANAEHGFVAAYKEWAKTQTFAQSVEFSNVELADSYQALCEDFEHLKKEHNLLEDTHAHLKVAYEQLKSQQLKPSWDDAPEWADWLAQNEYGEWSWFESEPKPREYGWWRAVTTGSKRASANKNWQQTLEQRPSETGIPVTEQKQRVETDKQVLTFWDKAPAKAHSAVTLIQFYDENGYRLADGTNWIIRTEQRPQPPVPVVAVGQVWRSDNFHQKCQIIGIDDESVAFEFKDIFKIRVLEIKDFLAKFERVS